MSQGTVTGPVLSPAAFRSALMIEDPATGEIVPLDSALDDWQRADFEAMDPALVRVCRGPQEGPDGCWLERARGHSKTTDIAIQVSYLLLSSPSAIRGVGAAASKDQAKILRNSIERLKRLNPELFSALEILNFRVRNVVTGSELEIISADASTSFGLQVDFIVADEVTHWEGDQGERLWGSLFSAAAKNSRCLLLVISNAGELGSWQHEIREAIRLESTWHFNSLNGPQASWLDQLRLDQQRRLLPEILYRRYWLNEWTGSSEAAFTAEQIQAAIVAGEFLASPSTSGTFHFASRGWVFFGALDLGIRQDFSAFAVVSKHVGWRAWDEKPMALTRLQKSLIDIGEIEPPEPELVESGEEGTGKLRLVSLLLWRPGDGLHVDVEAVERAIITAHAEFNLNAIWADPSQAEYLGQRLRKQGVPVESRDQTLPALHEQCLATLDAFREGMVELPEISELPSLIADLEKAEILARQTKVRLVSPRISGEGHGDCLTAFSLALSAARFSPSGRMPTIAPDTQLITVI